MMSAKGCQQRRIMGHDISFFCIRGKMRVVITYSCLYGDILRTTEPTLTIGESKTLGMLMYLICIGQLAKLGHSALLMKKGELWISGINHRVNDINVLSIEISPKEYMSMCKTAFDTRFSIQMLKLCPGFDSSE
jgi:hypothetical protein